MQDLRRRYATSTTSTTSAAAAVAEHDNNDGDDGDDDEYSTSSNRSSMAENVKREGTDHNNMQRNVETVALFLQQMAEHLARNGRQQQHPQRRSTTSTTKKKFVVLGEKDSKCLLYSSNTSIFHIVDFDPARFHSFPIDYISDDRKQQRKVMIHQLSNQESSKNYMMNWILFSIFREIYW